MIIGFGYKAGVGKDAAADYLRDNHGFVKRAFAGNLKECCKHVFDLTDIQVHGVEEKQALLDSPVIFDSKHYGGILAWMSSSINTTVVPMTYLFSALAGTVLRTPRDILQFVGTEIMRGQFHDYHTTVCFYDMPKDRDVVLSDVRFVNEAKAVINAGGFCVKILRDVGKMSEKNKSHKSEVDLDSWEGWSAVLDNKKAGLDNLHSNIETLLEELKNG